jgi:hypothetical protein
MPYLPPPAIVSTVDEKPAAPSLQAADIERAVTDLSEVLGISSDDIRASSRLSQGALRLRDVTITEVSRRNNEQEKYHPVGIRAGEFEFSENSLTYRLEKSQSAETVVCKLLRCPDPTLLTVQQVQSLAQANKADAQIYQALSKYAEQVGRGARDSKILFQGHERIVCLPGDAAGVLATRLAVVTDCISGKDEVLANLKVEAVRADLEMAGLIREAMHLRFVAQVEAMNFPFEASIGRRIFALSSEDDLTKELTPLRLLQERAVSNQMLSQQDAKIIQSLVGQARDLHLAARQEGALAAGVVAGLDRHIHDCLRAHHAALLYGDARISSLSDDKSAAEWVLKRDEIIARSRALVVREIGARTQAPSSLELTQIIEQLAALTSASDAKLALAEGVSAAKGSLLLEPESSVRTQKLRELEGIEARLCTECLGDLGMMPPGFEVDSTAISKLSTREQSVAFDALTRLLRDAFERHDGTSRKAIEEALRAFIDNANDPEIRKERELDALTAFAAFALEQPAVLNDGSPLLSDRVIGNSDRAREVLGSYLTAQLEELSAVRVAGRESLQRLVVGSQQHTRALRELVEVDRRFARCVTALQSGLAYDVIHAGSSELKMVAFSKLQTLLEPSHQEDLKALKEAQEEREKLRGIVGELEGVPSRNGDASLAVARGNLQVVEGIIARLSDSIVWSSVYEAKVALEAHDPMLAHEARRIIEDIPSEVELEPAAQRLVAAFKRQHESSQLIALAKQFLFESVRDNPKQTYALMIALGLLGAAGAYATRRGPHLGFLLASSATLAATKVFCITTGLESMSAAYATGLTYSTQGSAALDLFYLVSDLAQAGLLFGAYRGLKSSEQKGQRFEWPRDRKEFLRVLRQEVAEYAQAGVSQLDPRSLGFYLIGVPLTVGGYHIWTSGARPEEQLAQVVALASEVVPILIVAILHDRIMARLRVAQE